MGLITLQKLLKLRSVHFKQKAYSQVKITKATKKCSSSNPKLMNKLAKRLCRNREESDASLHCCWSAFIPAHCCSCVPFVSGESTVLLWIFSFFFPKSEAVRCCAGAAINETKLKAEPYNGRSLKFKHVSPKSCTFFKGVWSERPATADATKLEGF